MQRKVICEMCEAAFTLEELKAAQIVSERNGLLTLILDRRTHTFSNHKNNKRINESEEGSEAETTGAYETTDEATDAEPMGDHASDRGGFEANILGDFRQGDSETEGIQ